MLSDRSSDVIKKIKSAAASITTEREQWTKYRWEFMRRDPEYRKAYERVKLLHAQAQYQPGTFVEETSENGVRTVVDMYLGTPEFQEELEIAHSFDLRGLMLDPDKKFKGQMDQWRMPLYEMIGPFSKAKPVKVLASIGNYRVNTPDELLIKIDFRSVRSIEHLRELIDNNINAAWEIYKQASGRKKVPRKPDYDVILNILELKESGLSDYSIAKKLHPGKSTGKNNVASMLKTADRLKNGGWRNITFP
ncbi:MAG: hypothetical protein AB9866_12860 [Syntrophobacteraceae bacterium]